MLTHFAFAHWQWIWLTGAAFLAGMLNAVAGGGSFILFPVILSLPILPIQANATNTVALWPGQFTSVVAYRADIRKHIRLVIPICMVSLVCGTAGAIVLLNTPQLTFLHLVPWLLLFAAVLFAVSNPLVRCIERHRTPGAARHQRRLPLLIAIGITTFYIGYFGAGAGFLIITALSLFGFEDLHEVNAIKVAATTLSNGCAFVAFAVSGQVVWHYCLASMIACALGGYLSARTAKRLPQSFLRALVVVIGLSMAAWFFYRNR